MNFRTQLTGLATAALLLGAATGAQATVAIFNFTEGGVAAGFDPASTYGTVTVTEDAGGLDFSFLPTSPYRIHDGNANHNAFGFDMDGVAGVAVSNVTAGFVFLTGISSPPFGSYGFGFDCTSSCSGGGNAGGFAGPLNFRVTATNPITLASLTFNSVGGKNVYFTTDLVNVAGATGNLGATLTPGGGGVPEPASWGLMIMGFGGLGATLRANRRRLAFG
jgi:hypothetical protein